MEKVINLSDFPEDKIYLSFDDVTRSKLIDNSVKRLRLKNYFELSLLVNKRFEVKINGGDIKYWKEGKRLDRRTGKVHPKFMPLWIVKFLSDLNKISLNSLSSNVLSYRSGGSGLIVNKPIIPIKVTPELDSFVIHLFADGSAGNFTPSYMQKRKSSFDNFLKKLENCFGSFQKSIYTTENRYQLRFPKAITDVISNYYGVKSYLTYSSEVPAQIMNRANKKFKLASIVAFVVDEGYVRDVISVYSSNKKLVSQIRRLVLDCDYGCSDIQFNGRAGSYLFTLSNKDIKKFYNDVQDLSEEFPTCSLQFRDSDVRFIIDVININNPKDSKITNEAIIEILSNKELSAKSISKLIKYAYCTVLHRLQKMLKDGVVKRKKSLNGTYIWSVVKGKKKILSS